MKNPMNKWIKYGKIFFFISLLILLTGPLIPDLLVTYRMVHGPGDIVYFLLVALGTLVTLVPPVLSFVLCIYGLLHMDKEKETGRGDAITIISIFSVFLIFVAMATILSISAK